jgi:hypothetical protein
MLIFRKIKYRSFQMIDNIKYRVEYYESERGRGSDRWTTDYNSEKEAKDIVEETNLKYGGQAITPDYYIIATYIGPVVK